jgi:hypothetical protein
MIACMMAIAHWTPLNQSRPNQSTLSPPQDFICPLDEFSEVDQHASQLRTTHTNTAAATTAAH